MGYSSNLASSLKRMDVLIVVGLLVITVFASVAYAAVPVVGFNIEPSQTSETAVTINVHINDTESDPVSIAIRYSLDDGVTWENASHLSGAAFPIVGNTVTEITTYGDGMNNRSNVAFFWNFLEESVIESSDTVRIEVTPQDSSGVGTSLISSAFEIVTPYSPPVFDDGSGEVTDITKTSAVVNYIISDVGSADLAHFELQYASEVYFLEHDSYEENEPITYSGAFALSGATNIDGLTCGTTYHFVQSFTNGDDESVTSDDATFTTLACDEYLKFYWPLDEEAGDATGVLSEYPGTLYGGVAWLSGGGVSLDGIDDYVRTDSTLTESMGVSDQAYTLSASVRVSEENETGNIIHISNNGNGIGWCIAMLHIENGYFRAIGWDGDAVTAVNSVPAVLGEWYSIANTWSPETETLDLYVNGVLVASTPMTNYQAADVPVYVFAGINATGCSNNKGWFKGDVKDVRIYSRAITEEEAEENANASLGVISATTLSPEDDEEGVGLNESLVITFSTSIVATSTGNIGIYHAVDDSLFEEFDVVESERISINEDEVTINPTADFVWDTEYYVIVSPTAFEDALGNTYPGITSSSTWSFTTLSEPVEEDFGDDNDIPEDSIYEMLRQSFDGLEDSFWTGVAASSDGSRLVAVGSGFFGDEVGSAGVIYISTNGGESWELSTSSPDTMYTSVISSADGMTLMTIGPTLQDGFNAFSFVVTKSVDGGETWSAQTIQEFEMEDLDEVYQNELSFFVILYISRMTASSDLSKVYITLFDRVLYSDDGGEQWETVLDLAELVEEVLVFPLSISSSANGAKVAVVLSPLMGSPTASAAIFSDDYGENWTPVIYGGEVHPFSITVSKDGNRLFVTDTLAQDMLISLDDGETWSAGVNPDGHAWIYIAPSATGEAIIASAIEDVSDEFEDDSYWIKIHVYSSLDNGVTWTKQSESEPQDEGDFFGSFMGLLVGNLSGSYELSILGLVTFSELYVITRGEPTLPDEEEVSESRRSRSSSPRYGCKDKEAKNYRQFVSHRQSLCVYEGSPTNIPVTTAMLPTRDLAMGMTGEDVLLLQKILNANGYILAATGPGSVGNETTTFGVLTREATARFQAKQGIVPTAGYFGPITRAQMKAAGFTGVWW